MNITGVIHIGGHVGTEYDEYKNIESIKHMVFYEPDPDNFKKLEKKVSTDGRALCINRALGPFSCEANLHRESGNNAPPTPL